MSSRCGMRYETRRPRHHFGTQRAHSLAIQACWFFHHRCCPRTQRRPGCMCRLLCRSISSRRRSTGGTGSQTLALQRRNLGTATTGHSLSPSCLDGGRAIAPSHHADIASSRRNRSSAGGNTNFKLLFYAGEAAMTRAVLPNPSARADWLLAVSFVEPYITGADAVSFLVQLSIPFRQLHAFAAAAVYDANFPK